MNSNVVELSANARSMQAQFSRSLIAQVGFRRDEKRGIDVGVEEWKNVLNQPSNFSFQTFVTAFFSILPIGLMNTALIFHLNWTFLGTGILLPFNSMPAINALLTMYLVRIYRRYILQLFGCKQKGAEDKGGSGLKPGMSSYAVSAMG